MFSDLGRGLEVGSYGSLNATGVIAGIILIVIGFMSVFWGKKLLKFTICLAGFAITAILALAVETAIVPPPDGEPIGWIYFLIAAVFGIGGAILSMFFFSVGLFILGFVAGFSLAGFFVSLGLWGIFGNDALRILFFIALGAIGGIIAIIIQDPVVIVLTSIWGAYALFVGVDIFIRTGFKDSAFNFLNGKGLESTSAGVIGMAVGVAGLSVVGILVQYKA